MDKLSNLKARESDREKVELWLNHINEHDQATRDEVFELCKNDKEARAYFVKRHDEDVK